jgi:hypothetical protein
VQLHIRKVFLMFCTLCSSGDAVYVGLLQDAGVGVPVLATDPQDVL